METKPTAVERKVKWGGDISAETLWRCMCAIHLTSHVESNFLSRGGLMLVAPPQAMKTSFLMAVADSFNTAVPVGDLNTAQLIKMKSAMSGNTLRTLILPDMQKITQRNASVAANVLGNLSAVADEGFTGASWDTNQMVPRTIARCTIMAALTDDYYNKSIDEFTASGFARRFLWAQIRLQDPKLLSESVIYGERLHFSRDVGLPPLPSRGTIPQTVTPDEARELYQVSQHQAGADAIAFQLVVKMAAVLKWWYSVMKIDADAMDTMFEFGRCLGSGTEPSSITGLFLPSRHVDELMGNKVASIGLPFDANPPLTIETPYATSVFKSRAYQIQKAKLEQAREEIKKGRKKA